MSTVRLHAWRFGAALFLSSGLALAAGVAAPARPQGEFRVVRGIAAPWLAPERAESIDRRRWLGGTVRFDAARFEAPEAGLSCDDAELSTGLREPAGLFQGNLPAPAAQAAARLGLTGAATASVDLTCASGVFDFHWATPDALLLALDDVVWVLDRSPGALAAADSPEGTVQRMLEAHFAGDMGFDATTFATRREWTSAALDAAADAYFAHPFPTDEVPPIDGDPITDAQEYPRFFSVREGRRTGDVASVPVRYDDGYATRAVDFVLRREAGGWRVDDIRYPQGGSWRGRLAERGEPVR